MSTSSRLFLAISNVQQHPSSPDNGPRRTLRPSVLTSVFPWRLLVEAHDITFCYDNLLHLLSGYTMHTISLDGTRLE